MKNETTPNNDSGTNTVAFENQVCKNCGHHYQGNYCPACGQSKFSFDRPIKFLIVDFAGNLFAFDTRLWRSLTTIFFKPGKMEAEYTAGKRKKYMPPFRFYLFFSFFFFLLMAYTVNKELRGITIASSGSPVEVVFQGKAKLESGPSEEEKAIEEKVDSRSNIVKISNTNGEVITNITLDDIKNNPEKYFSRFVKYVSWAMFFLMPLYGFLLWLFFRKSQRYYLSHLILSLNQHVLIFTVVIIIVLAGMLFGSKAAGYASNLLFLIPVYIVVGAKKLYSKRWLSTTLRISTALFIYSLISILVTGTMLLLAVLA
jgi:uncharacterized membrane protein SirB2/rRNA maturation endonuclease Nob1